VRSAPAVSVLIPVWNGARTLGEAFDSVRAQTLTDWEAVVVDDGSTDSTPDLLRALLDPRIRFISTPPRGIVPALNAGLELCRASLVARFDADDLMHPDRLALQAKALIEQPGLAGVGSLIECFPRDALRDGMRRYESWLNSLVSPDEIRRERFVEAPVVHPSMTLRRDVLLNVGGWHDSPWPEDWDLWLRLLEHGHKLAKVPQVLHFWRDGADRLTRTDARYSPEALTTARAHYLTRGPLNDRPAVVWGAGPVGKGLMKALRFEGATIEAFIDVDPRKIGQRVHGLPVLNQTQLSRFRGSAVLLAAVGAAGARDEIRIAAAAAGFVEGADFFACA